MKVTFSNTSPGATNTFYYDFGDGSPIFTTRDKSPVEHIYNTLITQDFTVKMVAENECGTNEQSFVIRVAPNTITPELVVNANEKEGCAPFTVNFYNNSKGANLFKYDFGDGATLLTRTAPEMVPHTFERSGIYTVTLTASNGCSVVSTSETITVLEQPLTAFSANNTTGCPGMEVKFINTSTGAVSQLWDFGDGTSSNEFEPSHVYSGQGPFYTVTLTTTNGLGCIHRLIQSNFIHIVSPPIAQFSVKPGIQISIPNYTFNFIDESNNTPDQWNWDFGDHTSSALKNPSHTYLDTGLYKVTLRVSNQQGCFTETNKSVRITGVPGYLFLPNSFIPGSETNELRVFSAKGSGIRSWQFSIYDKWGEKMWETSLLEEGRPVEGWDGNFKGQPMPQGVYYWKVEVQMINGSEWKGMTYGAAAPKRTGPIHLIR
jgi:PKD repeat protein